MFRSAERIVAVEFRIDQPELAAQLLQLAAIQRRGLRRQQLLNPSSGASGDAGLAEARGDSMQLRSCCADETRVKDRVAAGNEPGPALGGPHELIECTREAASSPRSEQASPFVLEQGQRQILAPGDDQLARSFTLHSAVQRKRQSQPQLDDRRGDEERQAPASSAEVRARAHRKRCRRDD